MIKSRQDYLEYLEADRIALNRPKTLQKYLLDEIWDYQRRLRRVEYLLNCNGNPLFKAIAQFRFKRKGARLGFTIAPNTCGPGLALAHIGTVVISNAARIGANCRIHAGVNIGTQAGEKGAAPQIGNNCYIGPGAKLFGPIVLGDGTVIGANAVVNKSFPDGEATLAGVPAQIVAERTSDGLLNKGFDTAQPPADTRSSTDHEA